MSEHTPGPWKAVKLLPDGVIIRREGWEIDTYDYCVAGHIPHAAPFRKQADAVLAAAAPESLAACEAAEITVLEYIVELSGPVPDGPRETLSLLQAAIAKMRGVDDA